MRRFQGRGEAPTEPTYGVRRSLGGLTVEPTPPRPLPAQGPGLCRGPARLPLPQGQKYFPSQGRK